MKRFLTVLVLAVAALAVANVSHAQIWPALSGDQLTDSLECVFEYSSVGLIEPHPEFIGATMTGEVVGISGGNTISLNRDEITYSNGRVVSIGVCEFLTWNSAAGSYVKAIPTGDVTGVGEMVAVYSDSVVYLRGFIFQKGSVFWFVMPPDEMWVSTNDGRAAARPILAQK